MIIPEVTLEDIIYNTYTENGMYPEGTEAGREKLREKGLHIVGTLHRQVQLGDYGRADLIEVYKSDNDDLIYVDIFELKKDRVDSTTLSQAIRYKSALTILLHQHFPDHEVVFGYVLIGATEAGFLSQINGSAHEDHIIPISVYTYTYGVDGIEFTNHIYAGVSGWNPGNPSEVIASVKRLFVAQQPEKAEVKIKKTA